MEAIVSHSYRLVKEGADSYYYTTNIGEANAKKIEGYEIAGIEGYLIKSRQSLLTGKNTTQSANELIPVYRATFRKYKDQPNRNIYGLVMDDLSKVHGM